MGFLGTGAVNNYVLLENLKYWPTRNGLISINSGTVELPLPFPFQELHGYLVFKEPEWSLESAVQVYSQRMITKYCFQLFRWPITINFTLHPAPKTARSV